MEFGAIEFGLGAIVGLILALTGAGGGILAVPLLVFGLDLSIAQAAPVGLIAVGAAAAFGAILGLKEGLVRYRAAALMGMVGMAFAPVGLRLAQVIPNMPLTIGFALLLGFVAVRMFRQGRASQVGATQESKQAACVTGPDHRLVWTRRCAWAIVATGALSGVLSGLLGVGGGFVIVPALTRFTDLATRSIVASSLAVIALVSIGGVGAAALQGSVRWPVALPFAAGAIVALLIGRRLASRLGGPLLLQFFALASGIVALLLVARALGLIP